MRRAILVSSVVTLLIAVAATAFQNHKLSAEVPFDFYVAGEAMPAGRYVVDLGRAHGTGIVSMYNVRPGSGAIVGTTPGKAVRKDGRSELVFHRYGETYFLAEVSDAGRDMARRVPRSRMEKEMAIKLAHSPVRVVVALAR